MAVSDSTTYTCTKCEIEKPLTPEFYHRRNNKRGFRSICKVCLGYKGIARLTPPPPIDYGDHLGIQLTRGQIALIDKIDADLSDFIWGARLSSHYSKPSYIAARGVWNGEGMDSVVLHRVIMERILDSPLEPHELVDHENTNTLDDRRHNLRLASPSQNARNRGKTNKSTSGYKGVSWNKRSNKWVAQIVRNYKHIHLGYFDDPIEAYAAYCEAATKYHGEFARF
jgi:AP2 domain-containing protein